MAGLGIQQSMNSLIETGTNSVTAHELFMSRFNEYYHTIDKYNNLIGNNEGAPQEVKKVKSIKDRLNASTNVAEHQDLMNKALKADKMYKEQEAQYKQEAIKRGDVYKYDTIKQKITADDAKQRAEEARKQKLKEKAQARAKRPKPSTPDQVMKGVLNFHGNE